MTRATAGAATSPRYACSWASCLDLVLANNFLQLFIFWELVGLCSYLLIGFWFERPSAASAAKKAFLVTRIGDVMFMIGLIVLLTTFKTLDFHTLFDPAVIGSVNQGTLGPGPVLHVRRLHRQVGAVPAA